VPDDVGQRLEELADREGMSLSAFVVRELADVARRADNASLLAGLPDLGVEPDDVLADLESARRDR
jgi:predicted transcriptional regulator